MRASMAYFAGAGTIVVAIAAGLGGGLVISDVMNPHATRELGKVELQMKARQANAAQQSPQPDAAQASPQPSSSPATASNALPAPYLAQVQPAAKAPVVVGAAPSKPQEMPQDQPKSDAANAAAPAVNTSEPPAKRDDVAAAKPDDAPKVKQAEHTQPKPAEQTPAQPAAHDEASAPENAYAKARDANLKRQDDKRKSDRHQQWATRRQQQRDPDMRDVEEQVRRDSGPREVIVRRDDSDRRDYDRRDDDRRDDGRPTGFGFPHINFFGPND